MTPGEALLARFLPNGPLVDHHVHLVGRGRGFGSLCPELATAEVMLSSRRFTPMNPMWFAKTHVLMAAAGVTDLQHGNEQYARRLLALVRESPIPLVIHLLALDGYYRDDGTLDPELTDLLVPNEVVVTLCACLNQGLTGGRRFVPMVSVHPYRPDALDELERHAALGVTTVKWLPNVQNIDPRHPRCLAYYAKLAALGLTLLTHTGGERALRVPHPRDQERGNPLHYGLALEQGVRVVMAHCAREGSSRDALGRLRSNFELFREMLREPRWCGRLFGDLSAVSLPDTVHRLREMRDDPVFTGRLLPGSDYPLPAVDLLDPAWRMKRLGMITREEALGVSEVLRRNPLLGDWLVKRLGFGPEAGP